MRLAGSILAFLMAVSPLHVYAESEETQVRIGDSLQLPELTDQFDRRQTLDPATSWLVFSHDMASSDVVEMAFAKWNDEKLSAAGVQYYADISGMPGLISSFIAMPKLKKRPYTVVLGREDADLQHLPRQNGKAMMLKLNGGKLIEVESTDDPNVLNRVLVLED